MKRPSAIALQVLNAVFYGLDLNELQTYRERVNTITVDDIQRVAQQYLHPDKLSIVLVGDASVVHQTSCRASASTRSSASRSRSWTSRRRICAGMRRRAAGGRIEPVVFRPSTPPNPQATGRPAEAGEVRDLIARAVAAKGGVDVLRSIQHVEGRRPTTVVQSDGTTTDLRAPRTSGIPARSAATHSSRPAGWSRSSAPERPGSRIAAGVHDAPDSMVDQMRGNVQRDYRAPVPGAHDGKLTAQRLDDRGGAGRKLPALEVALPGSTPLTLVFDPATGSAEGAIRRERAGAAGDGRVEEIVRRLPRRPRPQGPVHDRGSPRGGAGGSHRTLRNFEFNVPVDPALFVKPS